MLPQGLDISHIQCVINYNLPDENNTYLHRIGRTGRMGQGGEAITIITNLEELNILKRHRAHNRRRHREKTIDLKLAPKPAHGSTGPRDFDDGERGAGGALEEEAEDSAADNDAALALRRLWLSLKPKRRKRFPTAAAEAARSTATEANEAADRVLSATSRGARLAPDNHTTG